MRWVLIVGATLASIIVIFDFTELLRKTSGKSFISLDIIIQMLLLKLPSLLEQLLPFTMLFSAILMFWHINRSREMIVIRAAGLSIVQIIRPIVTTALFIGLLDLFIVNPLSSSLLLRYEHMHDRYFKGNRGSLAVSESGLWLREVDETTQTVFHVRHVNADENKLSTITVFQSDRRDRFLRRLDAAEATFAVGKIKLSKVWGSAPAQTPEFVDHYDLTTSLTFTSLQNRGADPQSLSFWLIPQYIELLERSGLNGLKYALHWHSLIAQAAWAGIMVILAAACALRTIRQGRTLLTITIGIGMAFLLYVLKDVTYALGSSAKVPPLLAAWTPVFISGLLSITALLHFEEN